MSTETPKTDPGKALQSLGCLIVCVAAIVVILAVLVTIILA